jgi:hypothetical protein
MWRQDELARALVVCRYCLACLSVFSGNALFVLISLESAEVFGWCLFWGGVRSNENDVVNHARTECALSGCLGFSSSFARRLREQIKSLQVFSQDGSQQKSGNAFLISSPPLRVLSLRAEQRPLVLDWNELTGDNA